MIENNLRIMRIELQKAGYSDIESDMICKGFGSDLMAKFPEGSWKTINGAKVFVHGGKVVAGLDGFNGKIEDAFKEKKSESESSKEKELSLADLEKLSAQMQSNRKTIASEHGLSKPEINKLATAISGAGWNQAKGLNREHDVFFDKQDYDSLTEKGFLEKVGDKKYKLTDKTEKLAEFIMGGESAYNPESTKPEAKTESPEAAKWTAEQKLKVNYDFTKVSGIKDALSDLHKKQRVIAQAGEGLDDWDVLVRMKKEHPEAYKQASKEFETGDVKTRQEIFDSHYKDFYPKEYKQIQELKKERAELKKHLKSLGVNGDNLSRLGANDSLNPEKEYYGSDLLMKEIEKKLNHIEVSKDKNKLHSEFKKISELELKRIKESFDFFFESDYKKDEREKMHPEYKEAMKRTSETLNDFMKNYQKKTSDFKVGDRVFIELEAPKHETGVWNKPHEHPNGSITKITDKFLYIDNKRHPKDTKIYQIHY